MRLTLPFHFAILKIYGSAGLYSRKTKTMAKYVTMPKALKVRAPESWGLSCANTECTLHQLSPYIGKLKSFIARELIDEFSNPGDLLIDPFAGAGTIPLEAVLRNRNVFSSDISKYSMVLTLGKLFPPESESRALSDAERLQCYSKELSRPDLRSVPKWVRAFFHPNTLKDIINLVTVCMSEKAYFILSCLLGILHHQRPGFLSYPSSHLVPYLKNKQFPVDNYPSMYEYRDIRPRLLAKIRRAYKRFHGFSTRTSAEFLQCDIESLTIPREFDCLITSPPYMNALDYGRDNRLRLWFIDKSDFGRNEDQATKDSLAFERMITSLATKVNIGLKPGGHCILIVGETLTRSKRMSHPANFVMDLVSRRAPCLELKKFIIDEIPDIRRARRYCTGTKKELVLVYRRV